MKRWIPGRKMAWLLVAAASACTPREPTPRLSSTDVEAPFAAEELPRTDPAAKAWEGAPELVTKLLLQDQTEPRLTQAGVEMLRVRALHDGKWIAFRLQWDDATRDALTAAGRLSDAVAVQVPVEAGGNVPDGAMGQAGRPVRIHVWKAEWQDADGRKEDPIQVLYPNAKPDHYPFEMAGEKDRSAMEIRYAPARAAGNPMTSLRPGSPTQDLVAEGFGTLTALPGMVSVGRGIHDGRTWSVTIARPLDEDEGKALRAGKRTYAAFAVWDGATGNVGGRKMRSGWIPLALGEVR